MSAFIRLLGYLRPHLGLILLTWIVSLVILLLQGLSIWVGTGFLEQVISGRNATPAVSGAPLVALLDRLSREILVRPSPFQTVLAGVLVLVGSRLLICLGRSFKLIVFALVNQKILRRIRMELFERVNLLGLFFTRKVRPGEVSSIFVNDVDQLNFALIDAVDRCFMQPLRLALAIYLMVSLSPKLALFSLLFVGLAGVIIFYFGNRLENLVKQAMERTAGLQGHLTEYLSTMLLARMMGREDYESDRFAHFTDRLRATKARVMILSAITPEMVEGVLILGGGAILLLGGWDVFVSQSVPPDVLLKILFLLPLASYPTKALGSLYTSVKTSLASAKRIFALFDRASSLEEESPPGRAPAFRDRIEFKGVSLVIEGKPIVEDLSFSLEAGQTTLITGPSGAGKTTILGLLLGISEPTSGRIRVDGQPLEDLDGRAWRRMNGIVPQDCLMLNGTVAENLRYADPQATPEEMIQAMEGALFSRGKAMGRQLLEIEIGNRGELLSGGERQRLAIARALLNDPRILILHEPSSMLDHESTAQIKETIRSLARTRTVIVVTHDRSLLDLADREISIRDGRLEAGWEPEPRQGPGRLG
jgi:ABC-type multidrug transport system fused ATPase/permease subunit